MTSNDLRKIRRTDLIKFKSGYPEAGRKALFLRIVPDGKVGPDAPTIEYDLAGRIDRLSHRAFTLVK